ncbi:protein kinase [Pantoea agglomerans]|uniref:protein kinase domain-containing protein n=1 Tax=Enterobacter agglomerans TaxID=549 RepID=UPI0013BFE161|nr:protein kinase [Pantoea agglomerans]NEH20501.1 protein kinase [Pantoea agglomerans]
MIEKGNYFIESLEEIGSGGCGYVEKVKVYNSTKDHFTLFAKKTFSPSADNNTTEIKAVADLRERFLVEIKAQCRLNELNHKSIVHICLHDTSLDNPYFIMELGESNLADDIKNNRLDEYTKCQAVLSILSGLRTVHDNNYIHRDLKPANIIRFPDGFYKISDFGLVKDQDTLRAQVKTRFAPNELGTDGYRAPESIESGHFYKESDIYAFGRILKELYPEPNVGLKRVISKCTSYFYDERYRNVDSLFVDFSNSI